MVSDLQQWCVSNLKEISTILAQRGAILFRGFEVDQPEKVERFANVTINSILQGNTEHRPVSNQSMVQIPVEYEKEQTLLWHNENTFNNQWPGKAIFACGQPAEEGGETPLVDSRLVYDRLDEEVRQAFREKGVMYERRYSETDEIGLGWQTIFNTADKRQVERHCLKQSMSAEWTADGTLITRAVRPSVHMQQETRRWSWINQAQHWHIACLHKELREAVEALYEDGCYPRNCFFGDGSAIPDLYMKHILETYAENEFVFRWRKGDVLLVNNAIVAHGRKPYKGDRTIFVCFGDNKKFNE